MKTNLPTKDSEDARSCAVSLFIQKLEVTNRTSDCHTISMSRIQFRQAVLLALPMASALNASLQ
jgi:hypothetical protein